MSAVAIQHPRHVATFVGNEAVRGGRVTRGSVALELQPQFTPGVYLRNDAERTLL